MSKGFKLAIFTFVSLGLVLVIGFIGAISYYFFSGRSCYTEAVDAIKIVKTNRASGFQRMTEVLEKARDKKIDPTDKANAFYAISSWLDEAGYYERNLQIVDESIASCQASGKIGETANLLAQKAKALHKLGRGKEALPFALNAVETIKKDPKCAQWDSYLYTNLAEAYLDANRIEEAKSALTKAQTANSLDKTEKSHSRFKVLLLKAEIELAENQLAESEKDFATTMTFIDKTWKPGEGFQEEALQEYTKALKLHNFAERANYYNAKLDKPLNFYSTTWRSQTAFWD